MRRCKWARRWRFGPGYDWFFPYYRDRALCLALGVTPDDMMLQAVGAATDPASGGRQMPTHWSSRPLHIVSTSSSTTTQLLHAVGCAEAGRYFSRHPEAAAKAHGDYRAFHEVEFHGDEVVLTSLGEGSTSQGEFWEALNTASNQKLPVIFLRRRQRLRHQRSCRSEHAGRKHLAAGRQLSQLPFCRGGRQRSGGLPAGVSGRRRRIAARDAARRLCTGIACGSTRTRCLTTTSFTARLPSARPMPCAIPSPECSCGCCARAF